MIGGYVVCFASSAFREFGTLRMMSFDLGIFDQATWLISRGRRPFVTVRGCHILGDHFSAVLYLIALIYNIAPGPRTLLVVQTVGLAAGALPLYALANRRLNSPLLALAVAACYLAYPGVRLTNVDEFHPESLAPALLLGACCFLERRQWFGYALCLVLAASTRETVGPTIVALGLYVSFVSRPAGTLTVVGGVLAVLVAFKTTSFFGHVASNPYWSLYPWSGGTPMGLVTHPAVVMGRLFTADNAVYLCQLLYPLLLLPYLAPGLAAVALPAILMNMLSSNPDTHTIHSHYSVLAYPFLFAAAVEGLSRVRAWGYKAVLPTVSCALCFVALDSIREFPAERAVDGPSLNRCYAACSILSTIPQTSSISAQAVLVPHVSDRQRCYSFPNPFLRVAYGVSIAALQQQRGQQFPAYTPAQLQSAVDAAPVEYVALMMGTTTFPASDAVYQDSVCAMIRSTSYGIVDIRDGVLLFHKGTPRGPGIRQLELACHHRLNTNQSIQCAIDKWSRNVQWQ